MKTGLVVLNYNDYETTGKFLENHSGIGIDYIVVVDNCSSDNSYEYLKCFENDCISVIRTPVNKGYAFGNNFGCRFLIERYGLDILYISNPDIIFDREFVSMINSGFEQYQEYVALTGVMIYPDGHYDANPYLILPTYWKDIAQCFFLIRRLRRIYMRHRIKVDTSVEIQRVEALPGCLFAIRAKELNEIGFFDEKTFLYYEENILGKKLEKRNYLSGIITGKTYIHAHSVSINKNVDYLKRNRIYYDSVYYYHTKYNEISFLKKNLLKIAIQVSLIEYCILKFLK